MTKDEGCQIPYLPHTEHDREAMLKKIGIKSFEDLVGHIPADLRVKALKIQKGLSELELTQHVKELSSKNVPASSMSSFLGGGSYRRFVPAVVSQIVSRSEFATAYTPYQPEVSQGSLQVIYEFQTAVCLLTGMDVANASMYDGPTACAEAGLMASRLTGRHKLLVLCSVNPEYRMVAHAYAKACGLQWETVDSHEPTRVRSGSGRPQPSLASATKGIEAISFDQNTAALIVQYPNFFGSIEDMAALSKKAKDAGALFIVVTEPISLAVLTPPGDLGADIVVGDAQPCGNFLSFGGPSAGYMAAKKEFVRQLPGRLVGMTVDKNGKRAFTLTLQTREQHIRRAKATSNICTNQALNALAMLVYLSLLGKEGLAKLATISLQRAHYLYDQLIKIEGVKPVFNKPFFNEFLIKLPLPLEQVLPAMKKRGILAGINVRPMYAELDRSLLVAVTEMNDKDELDKFAEALKEVLSESTEAENLRKKEPKELLEATTRSGGEERAGADLDSCRRSGSLK